MDPQAVIKEFKGELTKIYGKRLEKIILYGSHARGTATGDSDIDLLVVLEGLVSPGREIERMIDCITDLNLKYDTLLSVVPMSRQAFYLQNSPLLLNVRREGIPA